jgi:threonine dehydratase
VLSLERGIWNNDAQVYLKLEQLQHSGSFKPRGAFNAILSHDVPSSGVIAASGGNHGLAVAYAAQQLGYHAEIFVPESCPRVKIERLRAYGAHVSIVGSVYAEALQASQVRAVETGALVVHAYDQPEVVAGQGTLGRELARQITNLDTVLIAVGGGGLIAGVASWFAGDVRVLGVEPERSTALATALREGEPVDVEVSGIAVDSLGARRAGQIAFGVAQEYVERVILVSDEAIREAQRTLWNDVRVVAEPGGATAAAALIGGLYRPAPGERVAIVVCGANASLEHIA